MSEYGEVETEEVEYEVMGEVETRLSMANYYKLFLNGTIFSDSETNPVAAAVEKEFQDYAKERLEVLLGMKAPKQAVAPSPFTPDEIAALKSLASKVITASQAPKLTPQTPAPAPTLMTVDTTPKAPTIKTIVAPAAPTLNTKSMEKKEPAVINEPDAKPVVPTIKVAKKVGRPKGSVNAPKKPKAGTKPLPIENAPPELKAKLENPEIQEKIARARARQAANPGGQVMPVSAKPLPRPSAEQALLIEGARAAKIKMIETNTGNDSAGTAY